MADGQAGPGREMPRLLEKLPAGRALEVGSLQPGGADGPGSPRAGRGAALRHLRGRQGPPAARGRGAGPPLPAGRSAGGQCFGRLECPRLGREQPGLCCAA